MLLGSKKESSRTKSKKEYHAIREEILLPTDTSCPKQSQRTEKMKETCRLLITPYLEPMCEAVENLVFFREWLQTVHTGTEVAPVDAHHRVGPLAQRQLQVRLVEGRPPQRTSTTRSQPAPR